MKKVKNVLLVDDDEITNHINKLLINDIKLTDQIHTALNGEEALNFIKNHCNEAPSKDVCPALVFLDLNMPVMDGFEFLENLGSLKEVSKENIPIFVLTSSENTNDIERAKKYKISGYVSKPLTKKKVNEIMQEVLNQEG